MLSLNCSVQLESGFLCWLSGVAPLQSVKMMSCGRDHTACVTWAGELWTWGDNREASAHLLTFHITVTLCSGQAGSCCQAQRWTALSSKQCGLPREGAMLSVGLNFRFKGADYFMQGCHVQMERSQKPRPWSLQDYDCVVRGVSYSSNHDRGVVKQCCCSAWSIPIIICGDISWWLQGDLMTWGGGKKGALGFGDEKNRLIPTKVPLPCFCLRQRDVLASGDGSGWEAHTRGLLWRAVYSGSISFVASIKVCLMITVFTHMQVIDVSGDLYTCGSGTNGRHGLGHEQDVLLPTLVEPLQKQVCLDPVR